MVTILSVLGYWSRWGLGCDRSGISVEPNQAQTITEAIHLLDARLALMSSSDQVLLVEAAALLHTEISAETVFLKRAIKWLEAGVGGAIRVRMGTDSDIHL